MPYESLDSGEAVLVLRATGATSFEVVDGFRYLDQYDDLREYVVPDNTPTDLASVPFFLQWLVRSYGKHTLAAIVHDQYWDKTKTLAELRQSNTMFRHAMWESDVAFIRRWFMWTAVTLAMLLMKQPVRVVVWIAGLVTAVAALASAAGGRLAWPVPLWALAVAAIFGVVTALGSYFGSNVITRICKKIAFGVGGLVPVVLLATAVGQSDWIADHAALVAVLALVVGLAAWLDLAVAGVIATVTVVGLVVPLLAVSFGLLFYGVFELAALGILRLARAGKRRAGKEVVGTLNPLATEALVAPPPEPGTTLAASQT